MTRQGRKVKVLPSQNLVSWDLETTVPQTDGEKPRILEIGAWVVDAVSLAEVRRYATLVRSPGISAESTSVNGITATEIERAPRFSEVAETVFGILHQQTWIGHNLKRFDVPLLQTEYEARGLKKPRPRLVIDTVEIFRGSRRGLTHDARLSTLARHFGLPPVSHRALPDCRTTFEVLTRWGCHEWLSHRYGVTKRQRSRERARRLRGVLKKALQDGQQILVSYRGGSRPGRFRRIEPKGWLDGQKGRVFKAVCCDTGLEKTYLVRRITDVKEDHE